MTKFTSAVLGALVLSLAGALPALAASFPEKPIRFVVPNTAGSATDQLARTVAQTVQQRTGQAVVVDNKAGANGIVAAEFVAKAAPDGYTVLIGNVTTNAANPFLFKKLPYSADKDFTAVSGLGRGYQVMVVNKDFPAKSVREFIAMAKANPGKYTFGSGGASARVATEAFAKQAEVKLLHVPYKGNPLALTDLMGGQITTLFTDMTTALPLVKSGKVRALAVTSKARSTYLPDVPSMEEEGLNGYQAGYWFAAYVPAGTPLDIVATLNGLMVDGVKSEGAAAFFKNVGMEAFVTTPEEMRDFNKVELVNWEQSIKAAGIEPE